MARSGDQTYDIVHIAAFVCPRSGTLYFSDVDLNSGESIVPESDMLSADALADLLQMARTKLACDRQLRLDCARRDARKRLPCYCSSGHGQSENDGGLGRSILFKTAPALSLSGTHSDYALKISRAPMRFYGRQVLKKVQSYSCRSLRSRRFPREADEHCREIPIPPARHLPVVAGSSLG